MKLGITDKKLWGNDFYKKLKSFGFDYVDYGMSDTTTVPYTYNEKDFEAYLENEKKLANEAGITIWQVHGPWRYPVSDGTEEERAERMEKMKRSIHGAAILGAEYWVIHPIMPLGTENTNQYL